MMKKIVTVIVAGSFVWASASFANAPKLQLKKANQSVASGNIDQAFILFKSVLDEDIDPVVKSNALFANGEYYYMLSNYLDANSTFKEYIANYPQEKGRIFALVYLFKMAELNKHSDLMNNLQKEIINWERQSFIFKDVSEYKYISSLNREHKAVYSIDSIEFFIEGKLFAKINY